jgi:hypothetical protein
MLTTVTVPPRWVFRWRAAIDSVQVEGVDDAFSPSRSRLPNPGIDAHVHRIRHLLDEYQYLHSSGL